MAEESDLEKKNALERTLRTSMLGITTRAARELRIALRSGQPIPDMRLLVQATIESRLKVQNRRVQRTFEPTISGILPKSLQPGRIESQFIEAETLRVLDGRSETQAAIIAQTVANNALAAVSAAHVAIVQSDDLTPDDLAALSSASLARLGKGQSTAVAATETQIASEATKGITAGMLLGGSLILRAEGPDANLAKKVWASQGDSRVRTGGQFDHLAADGQQVDSDGVFLVGGERLRWPGDVSLGASAGNIINCRCSALYEPASFRRARTAYVGRIAQDELNPFPQTESDVVVGVSLGL